ncbi:contractile injection system protein, VgrG/Pvc8 family [Paenibacillus polymyxa]|uniref:contractile injection system protein, VgrG/Pvc8 family n=1 Tax=Paenibacillus polymyxa TaxID=1406 RepID=UPI002ED35748|nr:contractile injection system protein, VgrG/Pvc8 family [Paenibacillus polymyxa]
MSAKPITYDQLEVTPFEFSQLIHVRVEQKLNEHAKLTLTGRIPEKLKESYIKNDYESQPIELKQRVAGDTVTLFSGIVTDIHLEVVKGVYSMTVEALSWTYLLDIQLKNTSFQHADMTYNELIAQVVASYSGSRFMNMISSNHRLGNYVLQYQETDWQFLQRMASRFQTCLLPAPYFSAPTFYFGVPQEKPGGEIHVSSFTVRKPLSQFRHLTENHVQGLQAADSIEYEVYSDQLLDLGSQVTFRGKELWVREAWMTMQDSILKLRYLLTPQAGLAFASTYNMAIIGLSLQGKVLSVHRDRVKVHLEIDNTQDEAKAFLFPYSTTYASEDNTGWYCMPEAGDSIRIYFPNQHEEKAMAISSIRRENPPEQTGSRGGGTSMVAEPVDPMCNPDIPYLKTKFGQIIKFTQQGIDIISSEGSSIHLSDDGIITVSSSQKIQFVAGEEIHMEAPTVKIEAEQMISLNCKGNTIEISNNDINIHGTQVKMN